MQIAPNIEYPISNILKNLVTRKSVENILRDIPDPELGISIYDLGLIYDILIKEGRVKIVMTLTTIGCPLFHLISAPIKEKVGKLEDVMEVEIELTFDPPWSPEKMTESAKMELGFS